MQTRALPVKFRRQFAQSVDEDSVFTTTAARLAYLTSPRRYPGQIVSDLEAGSVFMLNASGNAWIPLGSGSESGKDVFIQDEDFSVEFQDGVYVKRVVVIPSAPLAAFKLGTTLGGEEIQMAQSITETTSLTVERYFDEVGLLYLGGVTSMTTFIIYFE